MLLTIFNALLTLCVLNPSDTLKKENLVIFNPSKTYHYQATFINFAGDTLSKEQITFKPTGEPWKWDKKQTAFEIQYSYLPKDSIAFLSHLNPQSKKIDKPERYMWDKKIITGAIETDSQVWIHPIRENQYNYTEIAPFPSVMKDSLHIGGEWHSLLSITMGWGAFKGKVIRQYKVIKQENRLYGNLSLQNCWLINSVGEHDKLGKSYLDFYYHREYGFVEMNYRFYDGTKITFVLKEVVVKI
jgi:hypothetical protein